MNILIKNTLAVLPIGEDIIAQKADIYISGENIVGINQQPNNFIADKIINGENYATIPGLINCHTHTYMSFMKNVADNLPFMDWLFGRVMPIEDKMNNDDAYWGAKLGLAEMLKKGTTCINDMNMNFPQMAKAVDESGIRAVLGRGLVGSGNDEIGQDRLNQHYEVANKYKDHSRMIFALAPHAPYTCDEEYLRIVAEKAKQTNSLVHIHLSESESEVQQIQEKYGCSPIELSERTGLLENKTIAAHCVYLSDEDMDVFKKRSVSVVSNPASNIKLGNGFAPIEKYIEKGINVCLGTDSSASNNNMNMFKEMYLMAMVHKGKEKSPLTISPKQAFKMATINGAKALGLEDITGSIQVGKKADLVMLDLTNTNLFPYNDIFSAIVYSATGEEVENVIVNGELVVENKKLTTLDLNEIYPHIKNTIARIIE